MKAIRIFILLFAALALAGCSTPSGGTVDESEYNYNSYNSYNSNVPGRPDGIHTYPSGDNFYGPGFPMMPDGDRW